MTNKKQHPDDKSILRRETKSKNGDKDISRRQFIKRAGKASYIAPTLTVLTLASADVAAFSVPPPPTGSSEEPRNREEERQRR